MIPICVICRIDLLVQSNEALFNTPCGHVFHHTCLLQWLERSETCPQCRKMTTKQAIHKLYLSCHDDDNDDSSLVEDAKSLQNKLDYITVQLEFKDNVINNLTETKKELEKQISGLKQKAKYVERELNSKIVAILALQKRIKCFEQQSVELDEYKKNYEKLKEKVENLQNVLLSKDFKSKLDKMIARIFDHADRVTYIRVLRQKTSYLEQKKKFQLTIKSLKQKLMKSNKKCEIFEEYFKHKETQLNMGTVNMMLRFLYKLVSTHCNVSEYLENQNYMRNNFEKYGKTFEKEDIKEDVKAMTLHFKSSLNLKNDNCIITELDDNNTKSMKQKEEINAHKKKRLRLEIITKRISDLKNNNRCLIIKPDDNNTKSKRQEEKINACYENKRLRLETIAKRILDLNNNNMSYY